MCLGLLLETIEQQIGTVVQVAQQNAIQLTRANMRLDLLEQHITSSSASNCSASTSNTSFNDSAVLDASLIDAADIAEAMIGLVPCRAEVELETLEEALKDSSNREWMVRGFLYSEVIAMRECVADNNAYRHLNL